RIRYAPLIHQKAPIVLRPPEMIVTPDGLRDGLRDYLKRHRFANASWTDLIALLDERTPEDLAAGGNAWGGGGRGGRRSRPRSTATRSCSGRTTRCPGPA